MKFFKRTDRELDRDLQSLRSKPSDEFILRISGRILRSHSPAARSSRVKVGLAMGLTALGVIVFAVFGGLGYASSAASKATSVVSVVKVTTPAPAKVSVSSLPAPKPAATTTTSTTSYTSSSTGAKVVTWTGNGTSGGLCSSVSGSGSYQTWTFILNSPYNGSGSTLTATFATAGSRTISVTSTTSGGSNGAYQLPVTTGKGDRLLSASATNGTKNSVLTVSHCVLSGTTTGGGGGGGDHDSGDDNSSTDDNSGGGGGGGSCGGGSGGGSDDDSSDGNSSDSKSSSTKGKSSKHTRSVATNGGGSSHSGDNNSDDVSDDDDASSDDHSSGGGHDGGAGGDQYGGCIPICHKVSSSKYTLMLVSSADLAYHRAHGDLVPAPSTGCPGNDDSNSGGSKCNSGRGNGSEGDSSQLIKPSTGSKGTSPTKDCDPGNSGGKNKGGD